MDVDFYVASFLLAGRLRSLFAAIYVAHMLILFKFRTSKDFKSFAFIRICLLLLKENNLFQIRNHRKR